MTAVGEREFSRCSGTKQVMESAGSGSIEIPQVIAQANFQFSSALDEVSKYADKLNLNFPSCQLRLLPSNYGTGTAVV